MTLNFYEVTRQPDIEVIARVPVLGIDGLPYVAIAHTKSNTARVWDILDRDNSAFVCQLRGRGEAELWLCLAAQDAGLQRKGETSN